MTHAHAPQAQVLATTLAAGPDQSAARALMRPFEPVGYVYAGLATLGEDERDLRWRRLAGTLHEQGAPAPVITALGARLAASEQAPARLALLAAGDGTIRYEQRIADLGQPDIAGYAAPPTLVPLLACAQDRPPYVLVVADRAGADVSASRGGYRPAWTWSITGPDDEIERNAPGGWAGLAQSRYQHRAEDSWKHNAKRVAEEVVTRIGEVAAQVLLLAGDVRAVQLLVEALPHDPAPLIAHLAGGRSPDGSQAGRADQVAHALHDAAATQTSLLLGQFRAHLDPGGLAVEGWPAVLDALTAGRVATLLIGDTAGERATAWFGARATEIYHDHDTAAVSGQPIRSGRRGEVAIRSALLSGARVRIIPPDAPGAPAGGIGAICRYGR